MKKKVLLSSILTIAICLCLIAGSTFALFTANDEFNIAVTAGEVAVDASAEISQIYSAKGVAAGETAEDEFLVDENNEEYKHEALGKNAEDRWIFTNGGEVVMDGEGLKLSRLTPGDKVDVKINVANNSDVAIQYRYKIFVNEVDENGDPVDFYLAYGMVLSVLEDDDDTTDDNLTYAVSAYERFASYTSEWYYVAAPGGTAEEIETRMISVELPVYAGNEYQKRSVTYTVLVEAVQGNAVTDNESEAIIYPVPEAFGLKAPAVTYNDEKGIFDNPVENAFVLDNARLVGDNVIELGKYDTAVIENVTADVNGNVIETNEYNTLVIANSDFTLKEGKVLVDDNSGFQTQIILINVTVNGVKLDSSNYAQYINNPLGTILIYAE